jgi:ABC-type cobalt transport system substrate-binding protein
MNAAISRIRSFVAAGLSVSFLFGLATSTAIAANQTPTVSAVSKNAKSLPYILQLRERDMPKVLPTLQSFTFGQSHGLWVLIGGRTNGMHGFTSNPLENFPPAKQNRRIWVINPETGKRWSRRLDDSSLTPDQVDGLSSFAAQSLQIDDTLYVVGGYGFSHSLKDFKTYSTMTAFDLGNIIKWVRHEALPQGKEDLASLIRQTEDSALTITGGQMMMLGNRVILAFGQLFDGGYGGSSVTQVYSGQVRSFQIDDDGTTLAISDIRQRPATPNFDDYRRRDYNLVPILDIIGNRHVPKATALAGVFTLSNGMFTVPVEINRGGLPSMADPTAPDTFKQAMSGYNCAFLPIFDNASGESHNVLFGGISYVYYRPATGKFVTDPEFPFINDVTAVVRKADGSYHQVLIGEFPKVRTVDKKLLHFGAEAAVFLDPATPVTKNGMIDLAALKLAHGSNAVRVGWLYGGIAADAPNGGNSVASNLVFEIFVTPR